MRVTDKYVFFWASVLGNWSKPKNGIKVPGKYNIDDPDEDFNLPTSEHVFMYLKARYFGDYDIARMIKITPDPKEAKKLGRSVRGFSEESWEKYREEAMWTAITLRYDADERFRDYLMDPKFKGLMFVEANPYDSVWSCGYLEDDPRCDLPEETWPGLNLLGKLLTKLRDEKYLENSKTRKADRM